MGKFSKIKKYSKPSLDINEKIGNLNKELEKVGMLSEKMTTSTVYPDTETQPYIPPTYDLVPDSTGITGNSFSQPVNGGDENDSDTWADGWNSNAYLTNADELDGVTNRSIVSHVPNSPYDDGGGGMVITGRYFGTSVGYLSGGNVYKQVLSGGLIGGTNNPGTRSSRSDYYRALPDAEFDYAVSFWNTYQSLVNEYGYNSIPTVTVKAWVAYNRFHDYQRGGEFADWTGGPKKTTPDGDFILDTFAVVKVRSTDKYLSDPGQPRTAVLNRMDDIDSPHYHPGFIERALFGALDVGRRGLEYLRGKASKTKETISPAELEKLKMKAPGTHTPAEKQALLDAGLDDFVKGGQTASPLGNLAILGATAAVVKGALAFGLTKLGLMASGITAGDQAKKTFVDKVDNAGQYNQQLAGKLVTSILSGQPQEIKLSPAAKKDQIKNVDQEQFAQALQIGSIQKPSANSTVNPTQKRPVLTGGWGAQGGSEVRYDPKTDTLTITSEKMLRTGLPGDKFDITQGGQVSGGQVVNPGRQTAFGDIPEPTDAEVSKMTRDALNNVPIARDIINTLLPGGPFIVPGDFNDKTLEREPDKIYKTPYEYLQGNPEKMKEFTDNIGKVTNDISKGLVQGTASNTVALRKVLTNLGFPQSEVEKTGGGYGQVYSQTSYKGNEIPPELRRIINKKSSVKESVNLTEGWQSPKHTDIDSDERKRWFNPSDIAPPYPTKPPNTGVYTPSDDSIKTNKREPHIKITKDDLLKNHRLKDSEVKEMMDTINALNAFLDAHPEELIHARKRYPKNDVRLAELNWKMDQMLGASEEYLDGRFPENTRLFNKLQKSIKRNIELTDPKTFKNVKSPVTVNQLFTVDYISKEGIPILKKKAKSKNKKSPARFLKKPRLKTKSEMVQEKLSKFQDDLKKFGIDA